MRRVRRVLAEESAFTLIEVLISMAIFAIGSLGVLGMVMITVKLNFDARATNDASLLAQRKLEAMQIDPAPTTSPDFTACVVATPCWLDSTMALSTSVKAIQLSDVRGAGATSETRYQVTWYTNGSGTTGVSHILVVVSWPRNRELQALAQGVVGFVNCSTTPTECRRLEFHSYRKTS